MPSLPRTPSAAPADAPNSRSTIRRKAAHLRRHFAVFRRQLHRLRIQRRSLATVTDTEDCTCCEVFPPKSASHTESFQFVSKPPLPAILPSPSLASVQNRPWPSAPLAPSVTDGPPVTAGPPGLTDSSIVIGPHVIAPDALKFLRLRRARSAHDAKRELGVFDSCGRPLRAPEINSSAFRDAALTRYQDGYWYQPSRASRRAREPSPKNRRPDPRVPPLPDLPDEIWSQIGRWVVDEIGLMDVTNAQVNPQTLQEAVRQPAITRTCRYLRKDLLPYFYQNSLVIKMSASCQEAAKCWLAAIGPNNRRCLNNVFFVADWESHLLDPSNGATHKCGQVKVMVGLTKAECKTLGLIAYFNPAGSTIYARKIKFFETAHNAAALDKGASSKSTPI